MTELKVCWASGCGTAIDFVIYEQVVQAVIITHERKFTTVPLHALSVRAGPPGASIPGWPEID